MPTPGQEQPAADVGHALPLAAVVREPLGVDGLEPRQRGEELE